MILPKIVKSYNQNNHIIRCWTLSDMEYTFQSYWTQMFVISDHKIYFNSNVDNYTKTTCKYMYQALNWIIENIDDWNLTTNDINNSIELKNTIVDLLSSKNVKRAIMQYIIDTGNKIND